MKKIISLILILIIIILSLTACDGVRKYLDENNNEITFINHFKLIKLLDDNGTKTHLVADQDTNVMYYMFSLPGDYNFSITPYYISNGEIGIYGQNYFMED